MKRRAVILGLGATLVGGCSRISESSTASRVLDTAERWHLRAHRLLNPRDALAPEFSKADLSPFFRGNGTTQPGGQYPRHQANGFAEWRLEVRGLVHHPLSLSLDNIRRLPQRTQITRHDCVEGWSAIGEWTGPRLSVLLKAAGLRENARFVVFRCADTLAGSPYYESVDLLDAFHPQTIVAHSLNGAPLPVRNGAPLRMRIERQLGYKHAKYLTAIEVVDSLAPIGRGGGGYWEDRSGYQWYAGI